jgi:hypothetical protein
MNQITGVFAEILDLRMQCRSKKVAILGDVPGCCDELSELLDAIDWSPQSHILPRTKRISNEGIDPW